MGKCHLSAEVGLKRFSVAARRSMRLALQPHGPEESRSMELETTVDKTNVRCRDSEGLVKYASVALGARSITTRCVISKCSPPTLTAKSEKTQYLN